MADYSKVGVAGLNKNPVANSGNYLADIGTLIAAVQAHDLRLPASKNDAAMGTYDPTAQTYNLHPRHLRRSRAALARVRRQAGHFRVGVIGDSTSHGAGTGVQLGVSDWPTQLSTLLGQAGVPESGRWSTAVHAKQTAAIPDPRWVTVPDAWLNPGAGVLIGLQSFQDQTPIKWQSNNPGTVLSVLTYGVFPFDCRIDGGSWQTVTPAATNAAVVGLATVSGLSNTTHTVEMRVASGQNLFFFSGIRVGDGLPGASVLNCAIYGQTSGYYGGAANDLDAINTLLGWGADLAIVNLGINNGSPTGESVQYRADMRQIVTRFQAAGVEVLLVAHNNTGEQGSDDTAQFAALYSLADELDVPIFDLSIRWGTYAQALASGISDADQLHPTVAGHTDEALAMTSILTSAVTRGNAVTSDDIVCIKRITQAQYDALAVKDATTLYVIVG